MEGLTIMTSFDAWADYNDGSMSVSSTDGYWQISMVTTEYGADAESFWVIIDAVTGEIDRYIDMINDVDSFNQ